MDVVLELGGALVLIGATGLVLFLIAKGAKAATGGDGHTSDWSSLADGGAPIYRSNRMNENPALAAMCEEAIARKTFTVKSVNPSGRNVVAIRGPLGSYLVVVDFKSAEFVPTVIIQDAYEIGPDGEAAELKKVIASHLTA